MSDQDRIDRVISSALWSAYGDALGFMSELTDESGLQRRINETKISITKEWTRRIGGKFGVSVTLPAGAYSDDTQLRLATGRAIRGDGSFDVQSFAKVELPVWTSYALGAGRGTKAAASSLAKDTANWFSNFFLDNTVNYVEGGGNGAAMRIQPHVWAAPMGVSMEEIILPVIQNSICTHGNSRALVGAVVHALSVRFALLHERCPSIVELRDILNDATSLPSILTADRDLSLVWLPAWEARSGRSFKSAIEDTVREANVDLDCIEDVKKSSIEGSVRYSEAVRAVGGLDERQRGSGIKTALLAAFLADEFSSVGTQVALATAANLLGSDTDSIATMAGAIMGAAMPTTPENEIQDREYIQSEAERLAKISIGKKVPQFNYPDLFKWTPPQNQMEALIVDETEIYVSGLGPIVEEGRIFRSSPRAKEAWQFVGLEYGQTLFIKRRSAGLDQGDQKAVVRKASVADAIKVDKKNQVQLTLTGVEERVRVRSIDELTSLAIADAFDPTTIGYHILELSEGPNGVEKAVSYAAIIAKARLSRQKKR